MYYLLGLPANFYVFYVTLFLFQMLALSTLDALIQADKQQVWLTFMASKGYIQHIVDSLLEDNEQLITILSPQPQPLRALYIYQSKMVTISFVSEIILVSMNRV